MGKTENLNFSIIYKGFLVFVICLGFSVCVLPDLSFAASTFDCNPIEVLEHKNRIHVKCAKGAHYNPGRGGTGLTFQYFAVSKKDKAKANRFASMATAAFVTGSAFRVGYEPNINQVANVAGCRSNDCRTAVFFGIKK